MKQQRIHKPPSNKSIYYTYKQALEIKHGAQGKKVGNFRLKKSVPYGCSRPRRVCIKCLKNVIHKNDSNYDSKICKGCE